MEFWQKILECALAFTVDAATPTRATSGHRGWIPFSAATNGKWKKAKKPDAASWMPIRTYTKRLGAEWLELPAWEPKLRPGLLEHKA